MRKQKGRPFENSKKAKRFGRKGGKAVSKAKRIAARANIQEAHKARRAQRNPNGPSAMAELWGISRQAAAMRLKRGLVYEAVND